MKNKLLTPIIVGALAVISLFALSVSGLSHPKKKKEVSEQMGPMSGQQVEAADFNDILMAAKKKLHPQILIEVELLEGNLNQASTDSLKIYYNEELGKKWVDIKKPTIGAEYFLRSGLLENSEKKLTFASHLMYEGLQTEEEPRIRQWMGDVAEEALLRVIELEPENTDAKIELANILIEGKGQVMEGIAYLQGIAEADASNFPANMTLGKLAIQSNQLDKALERAQILLKHHPNSWEARLLMAEAYLRQGEKEKAIQYLNEAKTYNKDPEFGNDVDEYIKNIE